MPRAEQKQESTYDRHYRDGGFGYEHKRDSLREFVRHNYIDEFGMAGGQTLLDAGCGDGFWASLFHEGGLQVDAFDLSEGAIDVARKRYPGPRFEIGDIDGRLPFDEKRYDFVFTRNLSHFLRDIDQERARRAAATLLERVKPNGVLVFSQFSRRDGSATGSAINHPVSAYAVLLERVGEIKRFVQVSDHLIFGVVRR